MSNLHWISWHYLQKKAGWELIILNMLTFVHKCPFLSLAWDGIKTALSVSPSAKQCLWKVKTNTSDFEVSGAVIYYMLVCEVKPFPQQRSVLSSYLANPPIWYQSIEAQAAPGFWRNSKMVLWFVCCMLCWNTLDLLKGIRITLQNHVSGAATLFSAIKLAQFVIRTSPKCTWCHALRSSK